MAAGVGEDVCGRAWNPEPSARSSGSSEQREQSGLTLGGALAVVAVAQRGARVGRCPLDGRRVGGVIGHADTVAAGWVSRTVTKKSGPRRVPVVVRRVQEAPSRVGARAKVSAPSMERM